MRPDQHREGTRVRELDPGHVDCENVPGIASTPSIASANCLCVLRSMKLASTTRVPRCATRRSHGPPVSSVCRQPSGRSLLRQPDDDGSGAYGKRGDGCAQLESIRQVVGREIVAAVRTTGTKPAATSSPGHAPSHRLDRHAHTGRHVGRRFPARHRRRAPRRCRRRGCHRRPVHGLRCRPAAARSTRTGHGARAVGGRCGHRRRRRARSIGGAVAAASDRRSRHEPWRGAGPQRPHPAEHVSPVPATGFAPLAAAASIPFAWMSVAPQEQPLMVGRPR